MNAAYAPRVCGRFRRKYPALGAFYPFTLNTGPNDGFTQDVGCVLWVDTFTKGRSSLLFDETLVSSSSDSASARGNSAYVLTSTLSSQDPSLRHPFRPPNSRACRSESVRLILLRIESGRSNGGQT